MTQLYEGMILFSNQMVRENWKKAKQTVGDMLTKHEASIKSLRRFEERRMAYPIKGNLRATYYLAYFELDGANMPGLRRDMELSEPFLRNLIMAVDALPEDELAKAALEEDSAYTVPEPPADDEPEEEDEPEAEEGEGDDSEKAEGSEEGDDSKKSDEPKAEDKSDKSEEPAATPPTTPAETEA